MTRNFWCSRPVAWAVVVLAVACSDSTGPVVRPPTALNIVPLPAGHAAIFNPTVTFTAIKGQDIERNIYFDDGQGQPGDEYLRFRIDARSMLRRPDGSLINDGDQVQITITVVNPDSIQFRFQPTGLQFDPQHPADIRIEYDECGGDFDDDQDTDQQDVQIEDAVSIWRQPRPGDPYVELQSVKREDLDEIEADITSFSRFALAY